MILCIMTIYNEIDFLPLKMEWCRRNGLDLYVIDNYSDDFSYEWCIEHKVPCHRFDTGGSFHLDKLQNEIIRTTDILKPDWVVYAGADLFIFTDEPIKTLCKKAEQSGCNIMGWPVIDICNTGEEKGNPFRTYFWYRKAMDKISFVYKWRTGVKYKADNVIFPNKKSYDVPGIMMNFGRTKSIEQRKTLLKRRQKAWKEGLIYTSGRHYLREQRKGWRFPKSELEDIRESPYWKYLEPYQA